MKNFISLLILLGSLSACSTVEPDVSIEKSGNRFILKRNGMEFFINGAVGFTNPALLESCGANSVRIGGDFDNNLRKADSLGLTALVSLPMQAERRGFDYDDEMPVKQQTEDLLKTVRLIMFHKSILMWAVGNELDFIPGSKPYKLSVWNAVNEVAKQIKLIDPAHPVMTVIGTSRFEKVKDIIQRCPDIDLLCVNAYGDMKEIPGLLKKFGWTKPYVFTEWGVSGYWEVPKTKWNAPFEENSSRKAALYDEKYKTLILADSDQCLGSYVFYWGYRQETTPTWFNLLDGEGNYSEAVNVMRQYWTGRPVDNHAPRIDSLKLDGKSFYSNISLAPGVTDTASVFADDPENDSLTIRWEVRPEAVYADYAGQGEVTPRVVPGCITDDNKKIISFKSPSTAGAYRIYVYLYDGKKHFAAANFPFYVK